MDGRELKQYERWKEEVQFLRGENQRLEREVDTYLPAWYRSAKRIDKLETRKRDRCAFSYRSTILDATIGETNR